MLKAFNQRLKNQEKQNFFIFNSLGNHEHLFRKITAGLLGNEILPFKECQKIADTLDENFEKLKAFVKEIDDGNTEI